MATPKFLDFIAQDDRSEQGKFFSQVDHLGRFSRTKRRYQRFFANFVPRKNGKTVQNFQTKLNPRLGTDLLGLYTNYKHKQCAIKERH